MEWVLRLGMKKDKTRKYFGLILLIIGILTYINYDFKYASPLIPKEYELIRQAEDKKAVLELPYDHYCYAYFYFQTFHQKKLVNGIGIRYRPFYDTYFSQIRQNVFSAPQQTAAALNLGYIVIHKNHYPNSTTLEEDKKLISCFAVNKLWENKECVIFKLSESKPMPVRTTYGIDFSREEKSFVLFNNFSWSEVILGSPHFTFRWTIAQHSDIWVYLWPGSEKGLNCLEVCLHPFLRYPEDKRKVTVFINGRKLDTFSLATDWSVHKIVNIKNILRPGLNKISFKYDGAFRPCDYYQSNDQRLLSVAFDYLKLY